MLSGGRGSGKTTQICAWILVKLMGDDYARIVVSRYTEKSLKNSIFQDLLDMISNWNLGEYLHVTASSIENKTNGNQITTYSFKLSENSQSAKSKGLSNPNILIIEESTEIPHEEEVVKLIDSFRFKGADRKVIFAFNPESKAHWLFKKYYLPDGKPNPKWKPNHEFIHTTYLDNKENLDPTKIAEWQEAEVLDPEYYKHHILGHWRDIGEGQIFKTWRWDIYQPDPEAEILYGLDFGWVDPCVLIKTYKKGKTIWVEEIIYQSGITTEDLYELMVKAGVDKRASIYADSADPSSIETLRRMGYSNIRKAYKGPDSIRSGIDKIKSFQVFANPKSKNLIEEYNQYSYKPGQDQPIDNYNHLLDALRYSISHYKPEQGKYAVTSGRARPEIW
jgi:phage terminase large subunit